MLLSGGGNLILILRAHLRKSSRENQLSGSDPVKYGQIHKNVETFTVFGGAGIAAGERWWTLCRFPRVLMGIRETTSWVEGNRGD